MTLKIDFGESDFAPEETPKAVGGTELMQKWLFSRIDPELKDYFQWIASRVKESWKINQDCFGLMTSPKIQKLHFLKNIRIC